VLYLVPRGARCIWYQSAQGSILDKLRGSRQPIATDVCDSTHKSLIMRSQGPFRSGPLHRYTLFFGQSSTWWRRSHKFSGTRFRLYFLQYRDSVRISESSSYVTDDSFPANAPSSAPICPHLHLFRFPDCCYLSRYYASIVFVAFKFLNNQVQFTSQFELRIERRSRATVYCASIVTHQCACNQKPCTKNAGRKIGNNSNERATAKLAATSNVQAVTAIHERKIIETDARECMVRCDAG